MYGNLYIIYANLFLKIKKFILLFFIKFLGIYDCCLYDLLGEEDKEC